MCPAFVSLVSFQGMPLQTSVLYNWILLTELWFGRELHFNFLVLARDDTHSGLSCSISVKSQLSISSWSLLHCLSTLHLRDPHVPLHEPLAHQSLSSLWSGTHIALILQISFADHVLLLHMTTLNESAIPISWNSICTLISYIFGCEPLISPTQVHWFLYTQVLCTAEFRK